MQKRHADHALYFHEQKASTAISVMPYIARHQPLEKGTRVLEVGCSFGGNLYPFLEKGCMCYGLDLSERSIALAESFYANEPLRAHLHLATLDVHELTEDHEFVGGGGKFDVIFLRDVIEHLHERERFMHHIKNLLKPSGVLFFAFPPWRNPFGGHQQICRSKFLSHLPYIHLLPRALYRSVLSAFGESKNTQEDLLEIYDTALPIRTFERLYKNENYTLIEKTPYLINPNYKIKFGLEPRVLPAWACVPYLQDFYTTAMYYLLKAK